MKNTPLLSQSELEYHHLTQRQSKLSRAEYCRRYDINYKQLSSYASRQIKNKFNSDQNITNKPGFVPVSVVAKSEPAITPSEFTLTHPDGGQLSWSTHWSPEQVLEFVSGWRMQS